MAPETNADIVVTGTHIARPETESAMPVSVVRTEQAKQYARDTVYDALLLNPAVGPGLGETNSGGQEYDAGVSYINLRNLGSNRSLVLVDGKRWVSGGARTSAVDLNTIPNALVDRIEVVTGGAAAIYGADAVSGAVNIIMKNKLSGVQLSLTNGISDYGDGRQTDASIATGFKFGGDRGHFVIGAEYTDTTPINTLDRYTNRPSYYVNPANTGPNDGIPDNLLNTNTRQLNRSSVPTFCLPQSTAGAACSQFYQLIGGVVTAVPQSSYTVVTPGETGAQMGGPSTAGNAFEEVLLRARTAKATVYSHGSYELSPAITINGLVSYAHTYNRSTPEWPQIRDDVRPTNWFGGTTGEIATLTNPYLPASLRQFMLANGLTQIPLDRTYLNLPQAFEYHRRDNVTVGSDIGGKLTDRLNWQTFVRYGQVTDNITTTNIVGKNEWIAARNSVVDPTTGQIVCADATARANGCQPLNFFSTDPYSPALLNYIEHSRYERTKNTLLTAGGNVNGRVLSLPYGDVSIAAGVEFRRETLSTRDDPDTAKLADIIYSPGEDYSRHPNLDASRNTSEAYGEVVIPVLKDLPLAKRLEIEGAYRFSHYSDNPNTNTWKAGGTWEPISGLTLRGVYSHSVRVPNFGELFSPLSTQTYGQIPDPCQAGYINQAANRAANCAALLPGITPLPYPNLNAPVVFGGGNPNLTPERSNSYTLGAILQPRFMRGFELTADFWNIIIDNVITSLPYTTILNNCVDSAGGPNQTYCQYITRNALGQVVSVQAQYANLASRQARGIDIGFNFRAPVAGGLFHANLSSTYLLKELFVAQVGKLGTDYVGEYDFPRFKATLMTEYSFGKVSLGVNTRFISKSNYDNTAASSETYQYSSIPAYVYNDVTLTFRPTPRYNMSFGVRNISNIAVPVQLQQNAISPHLSGDSVAGKGAAGYYDAIGRYFFVKLGASF